jgi:hypothetical protein
LIDALFERGNHELYHKVIVDLFSVLRRRQYRKDATFSDEDYASLKPVDITRYLCFKAYGKMNPGVHDLPTKGRASSLEHYKKAISKYMTNRLQPWDERTSSGNPTKSQAVNDLIKAVRKHEVRKQGKKAKPFDLWNWMSSDWFNNAWQRNLIILQGLWSLH